MKRSRYLGVVGTVMLMLTAGCASTIPKEQVAMNEQFVWEIEDLKRRDAAVDSLQAAVKRLESRFTDHAQRLGARFAERQKEYDSVGNTVALLGDQVAALEREIAALRTMPKATPSVTTARLIEARYQTALAACRDRQFPKAIAGFREVLRKAPHHELADNAQYWLAECYYATGRFDEAIPGFKKVFAHPETDKDDDAQLKIAYSYFQKGDKAQALVELNKLLTDYPDSELAGKARSKIAQIEGM